LATATALLRGGIDMAVWFVRRLQWLVCEEFTLFPVEIATGARTVETSTNDRRGSVLRTRQRAHALNYGDAIV
jgi:hypothetical protein